MPLHPNCYYLIRAKDFNGTWRTWANNEKEKGAWKLARLVDIKLGNTWQEVELKNAKTNLVIRYWHYEKGEVPIREYLAYLDSFEKKKKAYQERRKNWTKNLLKASVFWKDEYKLLKREDDKPKYPPSLFSIDVDEETGLMGYDVALRSIRQRLKGHIYKFNVICIWTLSNAEFPQEMVAKMYMVDGVLKLKLQTNQKFNNLILKSPYPRIDLGLF